MKDGLGRLLLYRARPGNWVDYAILLQTCARGKDAYVHSAFLYPDGETVIESTYLRGVHQRRFDDGEYCDQFAINGMDALDWAIVLADAEKELGKGYDTRNILRFVTRQQAADDDHWFCSELTEEKLANRRFQLVNEPPYQTAPSHQGLSMRIRLEIPF